MGWEGTWRAFFSIVRVSPVNASAGWWLRESDNVLPPLDSQDSFEEAVVGAYLRLVLGRNSWFNASPRLQQVSRRHIAILTRAWKWPYPLVRTIHAEAPRPPDAERLRPLPDRWCVIFDGDPRKGGTSVYKTQEEARAAAVVLAMQGAGNPCIWGPEEFG